MKTPQKREKKLQVYNGWGVKNETKSESLFQQIDTRCMHDLDIKRDVVY